MVDLKNIVLKTPIETLERLLSPFIEEQFPSFMRRDYRKLVLFIKAYYEWTEQRGNPGFVLSRLDTIYDIDRSLDEFYSHFKATYLDGFPESFATNTSGNRPNKNTLLKHIRDFYGNKGTENAYKFLFRVLYDSDIEFYYPKEDILKTSDGRWVENISIKTTSTSGSVLFSAKGTTVYQYVGTALVASADVDNVVQYNQNGYEITEFFLKNLVGTFTNSIPVTFVINSQSYTENLYSVLSEFFIQTPGKNFRVGDEVLITDTKGTGFSAFIEQTGLGGTIKKIGVKNSGINYFNTVTVSFISETGDLSSAVVFASPTAVTRYPGFYINNSGKLSSTKRIQDGNYYQDFSYVLKTAVSLDTYFGVLKELVHPAGTRMFGSILVKDALDNTANTSTQGVIFRDPIIGNYTPYALRTFTNLRGTGFLPNQVRGATLQVWLSTYNISGGVSAGLTANWAEILQYATIGSTPGGRPVTIEDIFGVKDWVSLVGGHTFSHMSVYPNSNVWLTPNFKIEAVNGHPSVNFRPVQYNFIGPSTYYALVSHGFSGPTMGILGLSGSVSYFAVVKPNRLTTANSYGSLQTGNVLITDSGAWGGIFFGVTGTGNSLKDPKIFAFSYNTSSAISSVSGSIGTTGDWKIVSNTHNIISGNSGPFSLFLNGTCLGTVSQALQKGANTATSRMFVGAARDDSLNGVLDGEVAEIIAYQGDIGDADRQKIEGYLAHKYNLTTNLPSTHPYKTVAPGGSYGSGKWYGTTGDFYTSGYNPYIGSTAEVGIDGTTAPLGSAFFYSQLGYTYTVADEFGVTAHNPIGAPLGSTTSWLSGKETNLSPQGMRGLVLWLKPENIGVCGSVVNGASVDVWTDASPSANHALPPTWDRWNGVLTTTYTGSAGGGWSKQVYNTTPITKLQFVFNGLCGGFTTGRLVMVGLNTDPSTDADYGSIDYAFYSLGPHSAGANLNITRQFRVYESGVLIGIIENAGTNYSALDNSVCEVEYSEPNIIYRVGGVVKRTVYAGYGKTYYMDSSFYGDSSYATENGHSLTILGMWNGTNPVTPTAATTTTTAGLTTEIYAGVTVDKLRPTFQTASANGATGVSFNGGLVFSPQTTYRGVSLAAGISMGFTAAGSSAEKLLTGTHMYLKRPLKVTDDADIFVVYRTTLEGLSYGYGLLASRNTNVAYGNNTRLDSVMFSRSYNAEDRNLSLQNSSYYTILPNGTVLYPGASLPPAGLVGFRPYGDATGVLQNFIAYDPHVAGVCMGICVGEARRDTNNKIESFLNGDIATNSSPVTGRRIVSVSAPPTDNFITTKNMVFNFDAGKTASLGEFVTAKTANLLNQYPFRETPLNFIGPIAPSMWEGDGSPSSAVLVTQDGGASIGMDEIYEMTTGTSGNIYLNRGTGNGNAAGAWVNSTTTSTTWTASFTIRRDNGAAISGVSVYIYTPGSNDAAAGTIESLGGGWYRVTRTKTLTTAAAANILIGLTGLGVGVKYRIGRVFLQPYPANSENINIAGTTIRSSASYPVGYIVYGTATANEVGYKTGPSGLAETVWHGRNHSTNSTNGSFNGNVGFDSPVVSIDPTKLYRYSVWVNRVFLGNGRVFFGNDNISNILNRSTGLTTDLPYFTVDTENSSAYTGKQNQWVLVVGHVYPQGSGTGSNHPNSGFYLPNSGTTYAGLDTTYGGDKIWTSLSTTSKLQVFLYGSTIRNSEVQFLDPRIEVVDGSEISIEDLTSRSIKNVYDLSTTGAISQVLNKVDYSSDGGGCVVFDGPGVISTNTPLAFGSNRNITWEAWVKPSKLSEDPNMYMGAGGLPYFSNRSGRRLLWSVDQAGVQVLIQSAPEFFVLGAWHQVVCVSEYDGTTTRYTVYKNGVKIITTGTINGGAQVSSDTSTIGLVGQERLGGVSNNGSVVFSIGNRSNGVRFASRGTGGDNSFRGSVSNARVYSRALTEAEVRQNFNSLRNRFGV